MTSFAHRCGIHDAGREQAVQRLGRLVADQGLELRIDKFALFQNEWRPGTLPDTIEPLSGYDADEFPVWGPWQRAPAVSFALPRDAHGHYTLIVKARDIRFIVRYVISFWYFLTPVLYATSSLPHQYRVLANYNPITAPIELIKDSLLATGKPGSTSVFISCIGLAVRAGLTQK